MLRLLAFTAHQVGAIARSAHSFEPGENRIGSPPFRSTLMTSAPSSASW
jgi:hypothetical protein